MLILTKNKVLHFLILLSDISVIVLFLDLQHLNISFVSLGFEEQKFIELSTSVDLALNFKIFFAFIFLDLFLHLYIMFKENSIESRYYFLAFYCLIFLNFLLYSNAYLSIIWIQTLSLFFTNNNGGFIIGYHTEHNLGVYINQIIAILALLSLNFLISLFYNTNEPKGEEKKIDSNISEPSDLTKVISNRIVPDIYRICIIGLSILLLNLSGLPESLFELYNNPVDLHSNPLIISSMHFFQINFILFPLVIIIYRKSIIPESIQYILEKIRIKYSKKVFHFILNLLVLFFLFSSIYVLILNVNNYGEDPDASNFRISLYFELLGNIINLSLLCLILSVFYQGFQLPKRIKNLKKSVPKVDIQLKKLQSVLLICWLLYMVLVFSYLSTTTFQQVQYSENEAIYLGNIFQTVSIENDTIHGNLIYIQNMFDDKLVNLESTSIDTNVLLGFSTTGNDYQLKTCSAVKTVLSSNSTTTIEYDTYNQEYTIEYTLMTYLTIRTNTTLNMDYYYALGEISLDGECSMSSLPIEIFQQFNS